MTGPNTEPADEYVYRWLEFARDAVELYVRSLKFCESLLDEDLKAVDADEDLRAILGPEQRRTFPLDRFLRRLKSCREFLEERLRAPQQVEREIELDIGHGRVRLIKSAAILYMRHLARRRDHLALRPNISRHILGAVDQRLRELDEMLKIGVFAHATPIPVLVDELSIDVDPETLGAPTERLATGRELRPVIVRSIEILDAELRDRCLDLLEQFREEGQRDRLDTVVTEATRILEDRLRRLVGADATITGVDLAKHVFGDRKLVVSAIPAEQEAAHLLFRGVFGFIRNSVHHRLVADLEPERVLQIVAMIDYLISVAVSAAASEKPSP